MDAHVCRSRGKRGRIRNRDIGALCGRDNGIRGGQRRRSRVHRQRSAGDVNGVRSLEPESVARDADVLGQKFGFRLRSETEVTEVQLGLALSKDVELLCNNQLEAFHRHRHVLRRCQRQLLLRCREGEARRRQADRAVRHDIDGTRSNLDVLTGHDIQVAAHSEAGVTGGHAHLLAREDIRSDGPQLSVPRRGRQRRSRGHCRALAEEVQIECGVDFGLLAERFQQEVGRRDGNIAPSKHVEVFRGAKIRSLGQRLEPCGDRRERVRGHVHLLAVHRDGVDRVDLESVCDRLNFLRGRLD